MTYFEKLTSCLKKPETDNTWSFLSQTESNLEKEKTSILENQFAEMLKNDFHAEAYNLMT